jgi:hypothetical protein
MKNRIFLFLNVFIISLISAIIIAIYNFDKINSFMLEWENMTHPIEKFIFVFIVLLLLISLLVTILIDWIKKQFLSNK